MLSTGYSSEAALVAGLRAGESDAFSALMQRYGARLLRLARRFLSSEEDARDALQDAMSPSSDRSAVSSRARCSRPGCTASSSTRAS